MFSGGGKSDTGSACAASTNSVQSQPTRAFESLRGLGRLPNVTSRSKVLTLNASAAAAACRSTSIGVTLTELARMPRPLLGGSLMSFSAIALPDDLFRQFLGLFEKAHELLRQFRGRHRGNLLEPQRLLQALNHLCGK